MLRGDNAGEALPMDGGFDDRLEMLLKDAERSGEPTEMTAQDWDDIEREALAILGAKKIA